MYWVATMFNFVTMCRNPIFDKDTKQNVATILASNVVNNGNKMPLKVLKVGGHEIKQHT